MAKLRSVDGSRSSGRLGWLKPPKGGPDGTMSLLDHLRELRYRVFVSLVVIVSVAIGSAFFYENLVRFITDPYDQAKREVMEATAGKANIALTNLGVTSPFTLAVIACALAGLVLASPFWLYQVWAFFAPALFKNEKRYVLTFVGTATPLFLVGCYLGYVVWPRGVSLMLSFTPPNLDIVNLLEMVDFLQKQVMIMLVFGVSFTSPVLVVMLNLAGLVRGHHLGRYRKFVVLGSTIFAAVVTPTVDPFSMLALTLPVVVLFFIAEIICRMIDRKRGITKASAAEFSPKLDEEE